MECGVLMASVIAVFWFSRLSVGGAPSCGKCFPHLVFLWCCLRPILGTVRPLLLCGAEFPFGVVLIVLLLFPPFGCCPPSRSLVRRCFPLSLLLLDGAALTRLPPPSVGSEPPLVTETLQTFPVYFRTDSGILVSQCSWWMAVDPFACSAFLLSAKLIPVASGH